MKKSEYEVYLGSNGRIVLEDDNYRHLVELARGPGLFCEAGRPPSQGQVMLAGAKLDRAAYVDPSRVCLKITNISKVSHNRYLATVTGYGKMSAIGIIKADDMERGIYDVALLPREFRSKSGGIKVTGFDLV